MTTSRAAVRRLIAPVLAAPILAAAALAASPAAGAASNPVNCRDSGTATVCNKQGHASLRAEPAITGPAGSLFSSPWLPGYGNGPQPPMLAMD
ncbi:hypothetical protein [Mycolicibacterium sp.]|uniref:hypothetical protein n=1 Tax=Mycolicibacterium sp. TaxID=2320850 RepID=UPI0025D07437|nr:hypothetical protein [Mycolicibacterium sp.]MCB9409319.1 hypothetical protein [Mycolicibacterium sp.]